MLRLFGWDEQESWQTGGFHQAEAKLWIPGPIERSILEMRNGGFRFVIGVPPVIHFSRVFHELNHPASLGYPHLWNPPNFCTIPALAANVAGQVTRCTGSANVGINLRLSISSARVAMAGLDHKLE